MEQQTCKICGGSTIRSGNFQICEYCGNKWQIDAGNDIHAVERAQAWSALRDGYFDKAQELFENIALAEPDNHEAYWGMALAQAGILYVTDLNESKKVPTCNNITDQVFAKNPTVGKAISLAPRDIAESYRQQAARIDAIREEWLEKASREPAYDIFISYKDSDREKGLARTQDSVDAQDLYNALTAEGYKVFFSRISLRDKVSEQYEPYIYNAIRTAHVMIVFGESPEYFSAPWIKNEWGRFKARMEKGEKHKNSLVVVYKNMDPAELPVVLKARQCMDAGQMTFLPDLLRHIARVKEQASQSGKLERISIEGGVTAKKAKRLETNQVQVRQLGQAGAADTDINEAQTLSVVRTYMNAGQWSAAMGMLDDLLFDNPSLAEASWLKLLAGQRCNSAVSLKPVYFNRDSLSLIEKVLNCGSQKFAAQVLCDLYDCLNDREDDANAQLLEAILPYDFPSRNDRIEKTFKLAIDRSLPETFQVMLTSLREEEVDLYIRRNMDYAVKTASPDQAIACADRILAVDEGNPEALRLKLNLEISRDLCNARGTFETLLKYSPNVTEDVKKAVATATRYIQDAESHKAVMEFVKYYPGNLKDLSSVLCNIAAQDLRFALQEQAQEVYNLVLSNDAYCVDAFWGLCLLKSGVTKSGEKYEFSTYMTAVIMDLPEFRKCIGLAGEKEKEAYMRVAQDQIDWLNKRKEAVARELRGGVGIIGALFLGALTALGAWPTYSWGSTVARQWGDPHYSDTNMLIMGTCLVGAFTLIMAIVFLRSFFGIFGRISDRSRARKEAKRIRKLCESSESMNQ